jgi:hypothetical protein
VLSACGGGGDDAFETPGNPGGGGGGTATATQLSVVSSTPTIPSDGSANATITAFARDANNALVPGVQITFSSNSGGITPATATTDAGGAATSTLITAGDASPRTITVTVRSGSTLVATVPVQVVAGGGGTNTLRMGRGSGATFVQGSLEISNASLSAGGSTSVSAYIVNSDGTLYTQQATVNFNSPCIAASTATLQPGAAVQTTTGIATVTYQARGCSGPDIITATASVSGQSLSATGTVTVAPAAVGSIAFLSATPTNIALQGTGDAARPESSTVIFQVRDATGGPVPNAAVSFRLNTAVGGISLTPTTATSDTQGRVQTVVSAGTVATSVNVTATVTSVTPNISTQSSQLTVTTGIPTANSFSLAVQCFNIEGWDYDGTTTAVTARLGDRFQNPVPDGTAVTFTSEGGNIQSQCTTQTTATEGGVCSVNIRSSEPRPPNGRVTVLAKAIGEESFTDANGNGAFDNGETYVDLAEPFRDDNENGTYQVGEDFFDFNNDQSRTAADGLFNGVLCNDTTGRCGAASTRSTGIGRNAIVVFSGSFPVVTQPGNVALPASFPVGALNSARGISFYVRDARGNAMPSGTTVRLEATGASLSVASPNNFTIGCSTTTGEVSGTTVFPFTVTSGSTGGSGVLTLTITTPRNNVTTVQIPASVP